MWNVADFASDFDGPLKLFHLTDQALEEGGFSRAERSYDSDDLARFGLEAVDGEVDFFHLFFDLRLVFDFGNLFLGLRLLIAGFLLLLFLLRLCLLLQVLLHLDNVRVALVVLLSDFRGPGEFRALDLYFPGLLECFDIVFLFFGFEEVVDSGHGDFSVDEVSPTGDELRERSIEDIEEGEDGEGDSGVEVTTGCDVDSEDDDGDDRGGDLDDRVNLTEVHIVLEEHVHFARPDISELLLDELFPGVVLEDFEALEELVDPFGPFVYVDEGSHSEAGLLGLDMVDYLGGDEHQSWTEDTDGSQLVDDIDGGCDERRRCRHDHEKPAKKYQNFDNIYQDKIEHFPLVEVSP